MAIFYGTSQRLISTLKSTIKILWENDITCAMKKGRLRFSLHFYNTTEQINIALNVLRNI